LLHFRLARKIVHKLKLHSLYSSTKYYDDRIEEDEMGGGLVARMGDMRNTHKIMVGKPERKRPLGRPRRRCENNIKIDLSEIVLEEADVIHLSEDTDL
jgi:hypothetical protein